MLLNTLERKIRSRDVDATIEILNVYKNKWSMSIRIPNKPFEYQGHTISKISVLNVSSREKALLGLLEAWNQECVAESTSHDLLDEIY